MPKIKFTPYEKMRDAVDSKVGRVPKMPKGLSQGNWSEQALKVLEERYLKKDKDGAIIETPDELCWRVAWEIASAESLWGSNKKEVENLAREFYQLLISHKFLPNSPTLMNAGTYNNLQYSACFVLPVEDSLVGIFDSLKHQALIHQSGGGTGFAFSRLRPRGSIVGSSRGIASGPVSFMRIFDAATNEVKQGGKRRGANMGILRVDHPDIREFINCKQDGGITNFNISVGITEKFMEAYKKNEDYDLIDPKTGDKVGRLNAKKIMDEIVDGAWATGDPGVIFLDRINDSDANPVPPLGPIEATNPCGEQPLYPYDSCNLGSIFLPYFVKNEDGKKVFDWGQLKAVSKMTTRFMDNVIEMNPYPLKEIRDNSLSIRRIGLGVGGWADLLVELEIPYDSQEALKLGKRIMKVINTNAIKASQDLAKSRGAFPYFDQSIYKKQTPRRNSTVTTIAPTGSISIIAGTSSGIEPLFAIAYQHIVKDKHLDRTLTFVNPKFEEVAQREGFWSEQLREQIAEHGTVRNLESVPEKWRKIFGTAHEIDYEWHIKTQSSFQEHTENAVSKTINMVNSATRDDIKKAYLLAYETDCRGVTVFRDGCKDAQVLNLGVKNEQKQEAKEEQISAEQPHWERPLEVIGSTYKIRTPVGTAFITVNHDEFKNPIEVFINVGRAGSDVQAMAEALGRLISKSLKFGPNTTARERAAVIMDQLKGIGGRRSVGFGPNKILSLPDAVAYALSKHLGLNLNGQTQSDAANGHSHLNGHSPELDNTTLEIEVEPLSSNQAPLFENENPSSIGDICPSCGASALVYEEGCSKCHACGFSEC
jgi:ribonucleoside-diphosphate reductase alpha chain